MELKDMTIEQLEERKAAIKVELDAEGADLDALEAEARSIKDELEARKQAEAQKAEIRAAVAAGEGVVTTEFPKEEKKNMDINEIRNSKEYIEQYAEYIKTGEMRGALLSENATNGTVAVPELVYDIVKNAWQREGIMSRVRKAYIKGNLKIGFEISASGAVIHTEGAAAVDEETLVLGIVNLIPQSIKKWISISDEAMDLRGEAFLRYIYDELAYQIAKKAADELVAKIVACGTVSTTTCPSVPILASTATLGTIAAAMGKLSDQAANPVVIMNKSTWADFVALQAAGNYGFDPFMGLDVIYNNSLTSYAAATTGVTYAIVGDLGEGALANFPNGEEITFKFDDLTLASQDLVKVTGREFVGLGVIAPDHFVKITK